ncbi:hypothetical protein F5B20DRAFT_442138 [Whalleya microplaca]|nr:hypothetical protein F5B20DRAFT_442138 [Whalleya microplaca]
MAVHYLLGRQRMALLLACTTILLLLTWHHHSARRNSASFSSPLPPPPPGTVQLSAQDAPTPHIDLSNARAPFIAWPLQRVCAETTWVPGLVFICDNNSGGPGNIRNYMLTCIRYGISAGATSLLLPRIRARAPDDPASLFAKYQAFGYMFDAAHFRGALGAACPRMRVYDALQDVPGVSAKARREGRPVDGIIERVVPKKFGSRAGCDPRDQNRHTDRFGAAFRAWVERVPKELGVAPASAENPKLVRLSWGVLWDWEVYRDGPEFAATFGGLLRIREDILDLADVVVAEMRKLAAAAASTKGPGSGSASGPFLGIHLRTEKDALKQWPSYENQSTGYLLEAEKQGYRGGMAYLASGSETESQKFGNQAMARLQLDVKTKYDLLEGRNLRELKAMSWDQQALVDFIVLLNADYFVGVSPSSFSINVALKRHLQKEGLYTRPWKVGGPGDGRSWLVGRYERYWDDWLFMFDGMWP